MGRWVESGQNKRESFENHKEVVRSVGIMQILGAREVGACNFQAQRVRYLWDSLNSVCFHMYGCPVLPVWCFWVQTGHQIVN